LQLITQTREVLEQQIGFLSKTIVEIAGGFDKSRANRKSRAAMIGYKEA
jgi:hypothetical protein